MSPKILSVFIDESGDFGPYEAHSPFYLVSMVFHDQSIHISSYISAFESHLANLGYPSHAVHTGPLIRRESVYVNDLMENRKRLFNALFHFTRKLDIRYTYVKIKKSKYRDVISMTCQISKKIAEILKANDNLWNHYDKIIIYYDNGQVELTKILTAVFGTLYTNVEFRKVKPADYKLFQVADLICTLELLSAKADANTFSHSEIEFFGNIHAFKKNYLKYIRKKLL